MAGDVEDAAAARRGLGDDGGDGPCGVGARGRVDEQVAAGRERVDDVALRGVEVTHAPFLGRVGVADARGRELARERGRCLLGAGEGSDDLVPLEARGELVEVVDEDLPGWTNVPTSTRCASSKSPSTALPTAVMRASASEGSKPAG